MAALDSIGKVYRFNTLAPSVLGAAIINARLEGILGYERAMRLDPDLNARHRTVYPSLPQGTPDQLKNYTFYEFVTQAGKSLVLAGAWIDMASVEIVTHIDFSVHVYDSDLATMEEVGKLLATLGLNFKIESL